ncbi:hypothetical protein [Streptomyces collinus]
MVRSIVQSAHVVRHLVAGPLVRVLLTDTPLPGHDDVRAAHLQASRSSE